MPGKISTFWRARSTLQKCVAVGCAGSLIIVVILLIIMGSKNGGHDAQNLNMTPNVFEEKSCSTKHCATVAESIISSTSPVDPCDDFYEYACGGWVHRNPIPNDALAWGTFGKLNQDNQLVIKKALEKPLAEMKSKSERKAKLFYLSCLHSNIETNEQVWEALVTVLENDGDWNVTGGFNISNSSLQTSLQELHKIYTYDGLFQWEVDVNLRNSTRHILTVGQGERGVLGPGKTIADNLNFMTKVVVLLGGRENETRRQMQAVIDFETKIAEITTPVEEGGGIEKIYNFMTIGELQKLAPFISWLDFFRNVTKSVDKKINSETLLINYAPDYFSKLTELIQEYNNTTNGKKVLYNYLVWHTIRDAAQNAIARMWPHQDENLSRFCLSETVDAMSSAVGAMFVRDTFNGETKSKLQEMINEIRGTFVKNFKNLDWLDEETRKASEEKANAIISSIGFPDFILNADELDEYYKDLQVTENDYSLNRIRVNKWKMKKMVENLEKPVNKEEWNIAPHTTDTFYEMKDNRIFVPAGILQSPFYDMENPSSLNFGGIGTMIGRALIEALDDIGGQFDLHGNLHQWWNNATIDSFKNRTECFVKQYGDFEILGKHINGRLTLGGNIADNGGLKAAYHAYLNTPKSYQDQLPLPGLEFTHRQLFFVSFAQTWCLAMKTKSKKNLRILDDYHCHPKFRVNGPLSNLPEFSIEFNCPKGSKMNSKDKCEVF